ncbi:MAG: hypothetical protein U0271_00890 [Polyangiaceae bacterium]
MSKSARLALRLALAFSLIAVPTAGLLAFVTVDHAWSRWLAWVAVIATLLGPLGLGVLVENAALRLKREVRAELLAAAFYPVISAVVLVLTLGVYAPVTARALDGMSNRYGWARGVWGRAGEWLARRLDPSLPPHPTPSSSPSSSASASAAPTSTGVAPGMHAGGDSRPVGTPRTPQSGTAPPSSMPAPDGRFSSFSLYYDDAHPQGVEYTEAIPPGCGEPPSDLSDLAAQHSDKSLRKTAKALTERRYPDGLAFLEVQDDRALGTWFMGTETVADVASGLPTALHEGCHMWGFKHFDLGRVTYRLTADRVLTTKRLKNFDRSAILTRHVDQASDTYTKVYLVGKSGAQGFNLLLDEYNAYAHSLVAQYCVRDLLSPGTRVSARDGILTMMYYVETYLQIAREEHPKDYEAILADPGHRRMILAVWARAELWLRRSTGIGALGISDASIADWVYAPERIAEIARVRDAEVGKR